MTFFAGICRKPQDKISPSPKVTGVAFPSEDEEPAVITLVTGGEDTQGHPQWAYAKIPAQNYLPFKAAEEQGNYNLSDFGEILNSGRR